MAPTAHPCMLCRKSTNNSHALQCILCELWAHKGCGISEEMYKMCELQKKEMSSAFWICESCRSFSTKMSRQLKVMDNRIDKLEKSLKTKEDEIEQLKKDVLELKTKVVNPEKEKISNKPDTHEGINMMDELSDQEARKCNIICHNIPESSSSISETRKKHDLDFTKRLLNVLDANDGLNSIKTVKRLGKKDDSKIRPMLIVFDNCEIKSYLLSKCMELSERNDAWKDVKLSPDLTANQRKHDQQIRDEVSKLNSERSEEETLNFMFRAIGRKGQKRIIKVPLEETQPQLTLKQFIEGSVPKGKEGNLNPWRGRSQRKSSTREGFRFSTLMLEDF